MMEGLGCCRKFLWQVRCQRKCCRCLGCVSRRCRFNGTSVSDNSEVVLCQRCGMLANCPRSGPCGVVSTAFVSEEFGDTQYRSQRHLSRKNSEAVSVPMVFSGGELPQRVSDRSLAVIPGRWCGKLH